MASKAMSRLPDIGVGESLERGLDRTERALRKLDEGTYGMCDACGGPIPSGRLKAMPDGVLCLDCSASERRAASLIADPAPAFAFGTTPMIASVAGALVRPIPVPRTTIEHRPLCAPLPGHERNQPRTSARSNHRAGAPRAVARGLVACGGNVGADFRCERCGQPAGRGEIELAPGPGAPTAR